MNESYAVLYGKLSQLQLLLHRQRTSEIINRGPFADSARGQGRVLSMLKIQPEISTKDLAYILSIRQQSLNELLSKMEKGGYIERKPSEADKRIIMIHLTEKGKAVRQPEADVLDVFSCLNENELVEFGEYLDRIIDSLREKVGITPDDIEEWTEKVRKSIGNEHFDDFMHMHGRRKTFSEFYGKNNFFLI